jgi:hypothetical protein
MLKVQGKNKMSKSIRIPVAVDFVDKSNGFYNSMNFTLTALSSNKFRLENKFRILA